MRQSDAKCVCVQREIGDKGACKDFRESKITTDSEMTGEGLC